MILNLYQLDPAPAYPHLGYLAAAVGQIKAACRIMRASGGAPCR